MVSVEKEHVLPSSPHMMLLSGSKLKGGALGDPCAPWFVGGSQSIAVAMDALGLCIVSNNAGCRQCGMKFVGSTKE